MNNKYPALMIGALILLGSAPLHAQTYSAQHEQALKYFLSDEEKTVKDAIWSAKKIFKVGVINDGTPRDGYASYVCQVLYDYGFKGSKISVHVIDIVKLKREGEWVKLGESHCL